MIDDRLIKILEKKVEKESEKQTKLK